MRRQLFIVLLSVFCMGLSAQTAHEELAADPHLAGSNYLAYPTPTKPLTPAPKGYKPFYLSHYGRHGSRFLINRHEYTTPVHILQHADSLGKLTEKGKETLNKIRIMSLEADMRLGELTPLGAEQHRGIARRMFERFPEIFEGNVYINAKSTIVIRCILSMSNELLELYARNPQLRIVHDASMHDMYYLNLRDEVLNKQRENDATKEAIKAWEERHPIDNTPLMLRLFNDPQYVRDSINADYMASRLFDLANILQNTEARRQFDLYDLFTPDELYRHWQGSNRWWYTHYGASPYNGGTQPFTQRNLLRKIIEETDNCFRVNNVNYENDSYIKEQLGTSMPRIGATLRFGHETVVMPLVCLLGINGYDQVSDNLDDLEDKGWICYRVFPMGANLQFVFYRRDANDQDILFKVMLNEEEATLPLPSENKPYYRWSDFREYYLKKLDSYNGAGQ